MKLISISEMPLSNAARKISRPLQNRADQGLALWNSPIIVVFQIQRFIRQIFLPPKAMRHSPGQQRHPARPAEWVGNVGLSKNRAFLRKRIDVRRHNVGFLPEQLRIEAHIRIAKIVEQNQEDIGAFVRGKKRGTEKCASHGQQKQRKSKIQYHEKIYFYFIHYCRSEKN